MSYNLGVAEGHIDLNLDDLKNASIQAAKELQKIGDAGLLAKSEFNRLEAASKGMTGTFESTKQKTAALSSQIDAAKQKADVYRKGMKDLSDTIEQSKKKQSDLEAQIKETNARLEDAKNKYGDTSAQAQKYRDEITRMESEHATLSTRIEDCENKVVKYKTSLNDTETEIINLTRKLKESQSKLSLWGDSLADYGNRLEKMSGSLSGIGNALTLGVTTPILGIGVAAVKSGNDFEAQMSRVSAIAEAYGKDLEKLRQQAIDLGADTSFSATEAAEAMENLASAGFKTDEIMDAMPGMLDLAASSGEGLASSADIAASTLRGFQLEAAQAGHVADVLAKNAADTNAAIMDTGYAMKYIAPVAQSAGWSLEEVTAAIGVLADAGIKGEQAGTTLRGALVRLMKPTDDMLGAMESLGVTFYDAQGKMKPLSTIIDELQKATKKLTDEQRDQKIATIFGTNALSGMKVLLASSKTELDTLTKGLENADGAAKRMADTMLDNTKGSIEEMNGSLETAGITIQKQLAPWITKGAKSVTDLANRFSELDEGTQGAILGVAGIAAASGLAVKGLSAVTGGVGKLVKGTGGLIKDLGKISAAKNTAKAIGEIGTFSVKSVEGVSGMSKVLSKFASPGGAAVLAAGAVVGISTALWKLYEDSLDAKIAAQFGNIKLSAEEVEDVAKRITTTDWTMKLDATIEAQSKLKEFESSMNSALSDINKLDWKVSVGLELTEEEKQSYKDAMTSFVKSATDYVEQQHYTASLALQATLDPSSTTYEQLSDFSNSYYSSSEAKIKELGEKIADLLTKSTTATAFDKEKYQAEIKEAQQQMYDLIQEMAGEDLEAKIANMRLSYDGQGLGIDEESFTKLNAQIAENIQKIVDDSAQVREVTIKQINAKYDEDVKAGMLLGKSKEEAEKYAQAIKDKAVKELELNMAKQKSQVAIGGLEFSLGNIPETYQEALSGFEPEINKIFQGHTSKLAAEYSGDTTKMMAFIASDIKNSSKKLTDEERKLAKQIYEGLKPQKETLQQIADQFIKAGQTVPDGIKKGIADINRWGVAAEQTDAMWEYMVSNMSKSPEYLTALKTAIEQGKKVPESVAEQIKIYTGEVYNAQKGVWEKVALAGDASTTMLEQSVSATVTAIRDVALNRITQITPDITEKMSVLGFDTGKSFNDNIAAGVLNNIEVIEESATGAITGFKNKATGKVVEVTPELVSVMEALGVNMNVGAGKGLSSRVLNAPDIEDPNGEEYGKKWLQDIQKGLEKGVTVDINTGKITYPKDFVGPLPNGAVRAHADGGFITQPEIGLIGEAGPESIIPLSPTKRSRAIDLWEETGEILGVRAAATKLLEDVAAQQAAQEYMASRPLKSSTFGGIDYDLLADKLAKKLRESPIKTEATITVQNDLTVDLDGEVVGRKVTPTVSRIIANRSKM